jgi:hypothetical protein
MMGIFPLLIQDLMKLRPTGESVFNDYHDPFQLQSQTRRLSLSAKERSSLIRTTLFNRALGW